MKIRGDLDRDYQFLIICWRITFRSKYATRCRFGSARRVILGALAYPEPGKRGPKAGDAEVDSRLESIYPGALSQARLHRGVVPGLRRGHPGRPRKENADNISIKPKHGTSRAYTLGPWSGFGQPASGSMGEIGRAKSDNIPLAPVLKSQRGTSRADTLARPTFGFANVAPTRRRNRRAPRHTGKRCGHRPCPAHQP